METIDLITIGALILGPVFAVMTARFLEDEKNRKDRKYKIFRTLMRTRRTPTTQDHIGALNLIEVEYSKNSEVIEKWRDLFTHFGTNHQRDQNEEESKSDTNENKKNKTEKFYARLGDERQILLAELLHKMANSLNFKIEQLEIFKGGYVPQGWADTESYNIFVRNYLYDLATGRNIIPVGVIDYAQGKAQEPLKETTTKT